VSTALAALALAAAKEEMAVLAVTAVVERGG
jgi:hypothetical protein